MESKIVCERESARERNRERERERERETERQRDLRCSGEAYKDAHYRWCICKDNCDDNGAKVNISD